MNEEYYSVTKYTKKIKQELEMSVRKRPYDYTCYQCPDDNKLKLKHTFLNSESISENNSPAISGSVQKVTKRAEFLKYNFILITIFF